MITALGELMPNVDDWMDVLVVAMIVAGGWVTTLITLRRGQKRAVKSHDDLNDKMQGIRDQVVNGHTTPMRSDMDDMHDMLTDMHSLIVEQSRDIGRVRDDLHGLTSRIGKLEHLEHQRHDQRHRGA